MAYYKLTEKEKAVLPWTEGIKAAYEHSATTTFGHVILPKDSVVPEHKHVHEQWTFIISGKLEFTVEGETVIMGSGDLLHIPPNAAHSGKALEECVVVDVFNPARNDYRSHGQ